MACRGRAPSAAISPRTASSQPPASRCCGTRLRWSTILPWPRSLRNPIEGGNNLASLTVLPPEDLKGFGEREFCQAMSKETQRLPARLDWDNLAAEALELARLMPPGAERNEALKLASQLRCTADARGLTFAKRGRPRK